MANFTRVKPLGWSLFDILASTAMNLLDIDHAKSVNGDDGGSWAGPVELTDGRLHGTSVVNTSGQITTTATVTGNVVHATTNVTAAQDVVADSAVKADVGLFDRTQPRAAQEQSVDCAGGGSTVELDLVSFSHHVVSLSDGSGPSETAILSEVTLVTATGDADLQLKRGARFTITFKATQAGGMGIAFDAFPATVEGLRNSDLVGFRSSATESITIELEQIGTPGAPRLKAVGVTYGE